MPGVFVEAGRIRARKLEYNVVHHCNYACDQCSHFSPFLPKGLPSLESFEADLAALARVYRADRFRFVGGEPLLRKDIGAFIEAVRRSAIAHSIEICTNGSVLPRLEREVLPRIDRLSISWYPDPRCDRATIELARRRCAEAGVRLKVERITRFRAMQVEEPIADARLVGQLFRSCLIAHAWGCHTVHDGRFYMCSRPMFTGAYLELAGRSPEDFAEIDGCPLHEPDLLRRLVAYLSRQEPLASCAYCLGTAGKYAPWRSLTPAERKSPAPATLPPGRRIARWRLAYLLACAAVERRVLTMAPSRRLGEALALVKSLPIRD